MTTKKLSLQDAHVLQLELPLFEADEQRIAEDFEDAIAKRIREGIEAGLKTVDTAELLTADLQRVTEHLKGLPGDSQTILTWLRAAREVADANLATLTIFQEAINLAMARGAYSGSYADPKISRQDLMGDLYTQIEHHRNPQR